MRDCLISRSNLSGAKLTNCDLRNANVVASDFTNVDFSGSNLSGILPGLAVFIGAKGFDRAYVDAQERKHRAKLEAYR